MEQFTANQIYNFLQQLMYVGTICCHPQFQIDSEGIAIGRYLAIREVIDGELIHANGSYEFKKKYDFTPTEIGYLSIVYSGGMTEVDNYNEIKSLLGWKLIVSDTIRNISGRIIRVRIFRDDDTMYKWFAERKNLCVPSAYYLFDDDVVKGLKNIMKNSDKRIVNLSRRHSNSFAAIIAELGIISIKDEDCIFYKCIIEKQLTDKEIETLHQLYEMRKNFITVVATSEIISLQNKGLLDCSVCGINANGLFEVEVRLPKNRITTKVILPSTFNRVAFLQPTLCKWNSENGTISPLYDQQNRFHIFIYGHPYQKTMANVRPTYVDKTQDIIKLFCFTDTDLVNTYNYILKNRGIIRNGVFTPLNDFDKIEVYDGHQKINAGVLPDIDKPSWRVGMIMDFTINEGENIVV